MRELGYCIYKIDILSSIYKIKRNIKIYYISFYFLRLDYSKSIKQDQLPKVQHQQKLLKLQLKQILEYNNLILFVFSYPIS